MTQVDWVSVGVNTAIGAATVGLGSILTNTALGATKVTLGGFVANKAITAATSGVSGVAAKGITSFGTQAALNAGLSFNLGYWGKVTQNAIKGENLTDGAFESGIGDALGSIGGAFAERSIAKWLAKKQNNTFLKEIEKRSDDIVKINKTSEEYGFTPLGNPYIGREPHIALGVNRRNGELARFSEQSGIPFYENWRGWRESWNLFDDAKTMGYAIKNRMHQSDTISFNLENIDVSKQVKKSAIRNKKMLKEIDKTESIKDLFDLDRDRKLITSWELSTVLSDPNLLNKTKFFDTLETTVSRDEVWANLYGHNTLSKIFKRLKM
jgi:hypothetical protein